MAKKKNPRKDIKKTIKINYKKTENYRSYHVDGVFGGITPAGSIYLELFIQRSVTPQMVEHEINSNSVIGKEVNRESKEGIIRQIEAGLVMNAHTAVIIRDWLSAKIEDFKAIQNSVIEKKKI